MNEDRAIVAGIDGGATRTRAVVADTAGNILGFGVAGPSNYDNVGVETAAANIRDAVLMARKNSRAQGVPLSAIFLGMAGIVSPADRETVRQMVLTHGLAPAPAIGVDHDIRIALAGGLSGGEGIVLIAGTGSSTYGRRDDGTHHRTGWGYLLDDRGSGYFLGLHAIIATVMESDGRGAPTVLSTLVRSRLRYSHIDEILRIVYHDGLPVSDIASLAPDVIRAAGEGDEVAMGILATGAHELARMVETVARRLMFTGQPVPVTMVGGLVEHAGMYRDMVSAAIREAIPGAEITDPAFPPVVGALLLALDSAAVPRTEHILASLRSTLNVLE